MAWDIELYDPETHTAYRVTAKRLTVGDGVAVDTAQDALARREDLQGRALLNGQNYPLLRYGTRLAECAPCPDEPATTETGDLVWPADLVWTPLELTEAVYLALDELLAWAWLGAVLTKNPHRRSSYEALKKKSPTAAPALTSAPPTPASSTSGPDAASGSSASSSPTSRRKRPPAAATS